MVELFVESWFKEIGVVEVGRGVGLKGIFEGLCEGFEGEQTFGSAFEPCGGALATSRDDLWQDLQGFFEEHEFARHDASGGNFGADAFEIAGLTQAVSERIATLEVIVEIFDGIEPSPDLRFFLEGIG